MSIIRIIVGTLIGVCLLAGALWLAMQFPRAAAVVVLLLFGTGLLYLVMQGLRRGSISARRSRYERGVSPFSYWFYILLFSLLGMLALGCGVYCLVSPRM